MPINLNNVKKPLRLKGHRRHYHWGDLDFIPHLLGEANPKKHPFAELWFGSHPEGPATVLPTGMPLDRWLASHGFDPFPLILKVIASKEPLSIQVHPDAEQAEQGFRTGRFPDPHAKPEIFYALCDSWLLSGFRSLEEISGLFKKIPEWRPLYQGWTPTEEGLRLLYRKLMTMPQEEVNGLLTPLVERLRREGPFESDTPEHWLLVADHHFSTPERRDRGLFSIFLLDLVHLKPGEALFTPPRRLHALLGGCGIELMRCSDNVVRGGLTLKPIDIETLLEIASYDPRPPQRILPEQKGVLRRFATPDGTFTLHQLKLPPRKVCHLDRSGPKIGLILAGEVQMGPALFRQGEGFLILVDDALEVLAHSEAEIFYGTFSA